MKSYTYTELDELTGEVLPERAVLSTLLAGGGHHGGGGVIVVPAVPGRRGRQPGRRGPPGRDQQLVDAVRRRHRDRGRLTHTSMTAGHGPRGRAGVLPPALPVLLERPEGESMSQTNPRKITYADLDRLSGEVLPGRLLLSAVGRGGGGTEAVYACQYTHSAGTSACSAPACWPSRNRRR